MKHPSGPAPRRSPVPRKKVRLDLKRRPPPPDPEAELDRRQKSNFWKWILFVAAIHVVVIGLACYIYSQLPAPIPPQNFISLLPQGDVVKGTPGQQQAHKVGPTTTASIEHHTAPPPPAHVAVQPPPPPPPPKPQPVQAIEKPGALTPLADQPAPPKPVAPPKPKVPKVKVDLSKLEDAPELANNAPPKPKHTKKPVVKTDNADTTDDQPASHQSSGLSKDEIAQKLGEKMDDSGVANATHVGTSGAANSNASSFSGFYELIKEQLTDVWKNPNLTDVNAVSPVVQIHVEKDGRVPPESVRLVRSSGNSAFDDSAVEAAKNLGYLHEPLPDGCPPDISITCNLTQ